MSNDLPLPSSKLRALSSGLAAPSSELPARTSGLVVAAGRPAAVVAFETRVVEFFLEAAELLGVPKSVAAIYGIIFASPEPLSFADVEERLAISKGSVSQGLRVLREVGAIRVADVEPGATSLEPGAGSRGLGSPRDEAEVSDSELRASGSKLFSSASKLAAHNSQLASRSARYVPELELRKLVRHFLDQRLGRQLDAGKTRLKALDAAIPMGAEAEVLRMRLNSLKDWHRKARALLPVAKAFLKVT